MTTRIRSTLVVLVLVILATGLARADDGKYTARLNGALGEKAATEHTIWVRFADKGLTGTALDAALADLAAGMNADRLARRAKVESDGDLVGVADLPIHPGYLAEVTATGARHRQSSKWLNAASFEASAAQIAAIAALPFVDKLDLVGGGAPRREGIKGEPYPGLPATDSKSLAATDYGSSLDGLEMLNVPAAHAAGLSGAGVTIAVLDTGFETRHEAFDNLEIVDAWDFVDDDPIVGPQEGEHYQQTLYGTGTLSLIAGYSQSNLVGPAYGARVLLAKTEDLDDETPAEEDNWIAAVEWAEERGADVIASGLGYIDWYEFSDLDGGTALITAAAEMAAARGVCVVNQAGNERANAWQHIIPPADGRSVIAVGSADLNGQVTFWSSPGPTADGRIKPDLLALGAYVTIASYHAQGWYVPADGSNFASAQIAGAVALMLEQNPRLNPTQIGDALRETASRSSAPDNDFGWGIPDVVAALDYWAPTIVHEPLGDTEGGTGAYPVLATITDRLGLDTGRIHLAWRVAGENFTLVPMTSVGGDEYQGSIPPQSRVGTDVEYYLVATSITGTSARHPAAAESVLHTFRVGADTTPPTVKHVPLADQAAGLWAPIVSAEVTDNLGVDRVEIIATSSNGWNSGPQPMTETEPGVYEIPMPIPPEYAQQGVSVTYLISAYDTAAVPNFGLHGPYTLDILATRGHILLVDDRWLSKSTPRAEERAGNSVTPPREKDAASLADWITGAGFDVTVMAAEDVQASSFFGYDAVMVSCGGNFNPLGVPDLRRAMELWVPEGGRLLVEGGEVTYAVAEPPGYPELIGTVLPIKAYAGEDGARLSVPTTLVDHALATRPNALPSPLRINNNGGYDWSAADLAEAADDATVVLRASYGDTRGGVIVHDDNTGPDAGQVVFFPFDILKTEVEQEGRDLLENALVYLTFNEPPGTGSISGRVELAGADDHGGVTVRQGIQGSTTTAADGTFLLDGLWGGTSQITAEVDGYAPQVRVVTVVDDQETTDVVFYLMPVAEVNLTAAPGLPIPDNDPTGVESTIVVTEGGTIQGLTVDIGISHFSIGHLVVTLTSPEGTTVTLHNRTGGTADDLVGNWPGNLYVDGPGSLEDFLQESAQGTWTMQVADAQFGGTGTFDTWGLNLLVTATGVASTPDGTPAVTRLLGNSPNPFNPRTTISFETARQSRVAIEIYDVRGRLVRRLADRMFVVGRHTVVWDGKDSRGAEPASGIYFTRLRTEGSDEVRKMMLVR